MVPPVGAEEEEEMKRVAETAIFEPNSESDVLLVPMQEARKELLDGKEYMRMFPIQKVLGNPYRIRC